LLEETDKLNSHSDPIEERYVAMELRAGSCPIFFQIESVLALNGKLKVN